MGYKKNYFAESLSDFDAKKSKDFKKKLIRITTYLDFVLHIIAGNFLAYKKIKHLKKEFVFIFSRCFNAKIFSLIVL